jgi:hypothetical protein
MKLKFIAAAIFLLLAGYWILTHSFLIIGTGSALFAIFVVAVVIFVRSRK